MVHATLHIIRDEHAGLAAMLRSLLMMLDRGPGDAPETFFDVLRAMLFYIDEFPERQHHPKESDLLFPRVLRAAPETVKTIQRLELDHLNGEHRVRELQHQLIAWEVLGESRKPDFEVAARGYVAFYLEHMRLEEAVILPAAEKSLNQADWLELDAAFGSNRDLLTGQHPRDPVYDRLFTRIVMKTPAPIGLGA
ncbi:hemerythrin domain-containing protein [Polaromonas sp.]|uniref:hemerythrin domain-containing protein n=1 Tax=Polaromonas sp. TaxID=1869339 RepID=UPI00286B1308|nr:hemerythrin domain-containing protein [Polaromonas sp.]